MEHYLVELIGTNGHLFKTLGYYIVFFSGLLESVPLFGFIIPGQTIAVIGGFFAKKKIVSFLLIFTFVSLGAIFGDFLSFYLGRKYGERLLHKHCSKFYIKNHHILSTKKLVEDHPGKALFFGRLNSVTRSLAPFIAGTTNIKFPTFIFYCITGCIAWAGTFVTIGYLFGKSFEVVAPIIGKFVLMATLIVGLLVILTQYMKRRGYTLSEYSIAMLITNAVSIYVFGMLAQAVSKSSNLLRAFDIRIHSLIPELRDNTIDTIMLAISKITYGEFIICGSLLCFLLFYLKRKSDALATLGALTFGPLLVFLTKKYFEIPRPFDSLINENSFSFPSGHAAISTLFFFLVIHTFSPKIEKGLARIAFVSINALLILLISFSRIYLGVHFATDVIAGIALGAWVFSLSVLASKVMPWFYKRRRVSEILEKIP